MSYIKVECIGGDQPVARYTSGVTVYEEALVDGRWVGRYWSPIGRIEGNPQRKGELLDVSAFGLELDGQSLHRGWSFDGCEQLPPARAGQAHLAVILVHSLRPVRVRVHTVVDGTPVLMRWLEIENTGDQPAALARLWVWGGRVFPCQAGDAYYSQSYGDTVYEGPYGDYALGYFVENKHSSEGHFRWQPLGRETVEIGEDGGKSGWGHPIAYVRDARAGQVFVAQLAWSGNWAIRVEPKDASRDVRRQEPLLFLRMGPRATAPLRVLAPGEIVTTPVAHVGLVAGDLTDMVQGLHEHQRRSVLNPAPEGLANRVSYNNWGYMKHEMSEPRLLREIDIAASLGAEVFTIDAGWYGEPGQRWWVTGAWRPGDRLPNGLKPVFDYAHKKGLKCGLWVWIEAASEESRVIQEHPDWLLERDGHRLDNVLDLTKPEVAAWVEGEIQRIVVEYELDLFRLDYNAYPGEGGYSRRWGYDENTIWRHYEAMYGIWERVRARFPQLILENCAAGGARTDLGMVSRMHYTWFSDYTLAPRAIRMQNGMMLALPPEALARVTGVCMNGHLGGDLDTQLRMNILLGNPCFSGIWPTPEDANPEVLARIQHAVGLFKNVVRPMIGECKVFHHTPEIDGSLHPQGWCVIEVATPDANRAIVGVFRLAGESEPERVVRLRGLSRARQYQVTFDNRNEQIVLPGTQLVGEGVRVVLPQANTSELILATERS